MYFNRSALNVVSVLKQEPILFQPYFNIEGRSYVCWVCFYFWVQSTNELDTLITIKLIEKLRLIKLSYLCSLHVGFLEYWICNIQPDQMRKRNCDKEPIMYVIPAKIYKFITNLLKCKIVTNCHKIVLATSIYLLKWSLGCELRAYSAVNLLVYS